MTARTIVLPLFPGHETGPGGKSFLPGFPGFEDRMNLPQPMAPAPGHVTEGEASLVQENRDASHAANTRRNYTGGFRRFSAWCQDRGNLALPAAPKIVEIYLSLRAESGLTLGTVRGDRAAISFAHRERDLADPCNSNLVRKNMKGMANRLGREQAQAQPLTAECMAAIRATACTPRNRGGVGKRRESEEAARVRGNLDIAICQVMRDALLRRGEAAKLRWRDIEYCDGGGLVTIERSKTDQKGETAVVYISPQAAEDLRVIQPADPDPDARVFDLGDHSLCRRIRAAAIQAKLGDGFSGHSPRIGMTVDLSNANFETIRIMNAGRWKTVRMVAHYTRKVVAARGAVAQFYQRQGE